jgi:hypothetical protein
MREGAAAMSNPQAGERVWVRFDGSVKRGTISTVRQKDGQLIRDDAAVTIVLDGGTSVVATTVAARGAVWDFDTARATGGTT